MTTITKLPDLADLLVIGGGINGAGIACDAAGRGLSVVLCEKDDLAAATSSASSKLIHGGLRYLEHYEFRLVREALAERELLLAKAPHIIRPMGFVLPHAGTLRPAWVIRLGLFLYDHLARRGTLAGSRVLRLATAPEGRPLRQDIATGFAYADAWVDDARLVVLNARAAADAGAAVLTRTECTSVRRERGVWHVELRDRRTGRNFAARARALVNAAGPWVDTVLSRAEGVTASHHTRLVKGSHIVVPALHDGTHAYVLQNDDRRIVFVIPFEERFSLIGTTDVAYTGDPGEAAITGFEIQYLCDAVNRYFRRPVGREDVVWSFAGVRPLWDDAADDPSAVTRDYALELDGGQGLPPLLAVFGGKITTYRSLAEKALEALAPHLPAMGPPWTAAAALPGGDLKGDDFDTFRRRVRARWPWLGVEIADRIARCYGTRVADMLGDAVDLPDLGRGFGAGLYQREVAYLVAQEWAETADDILWRRTKLGLVMPAGGAAALSGWLSENSLSRHPAAH